MTSKYSFDGQHEDEEILFVFRRHPVVMRVGLMALLIGMLIGMLPITIWPERLIYLWYVLAGLAAGGLGLFFSWMGWFYSIFIITDQRFIQVSQKGLFNSSVVDIGLNKIQNVNFQLAGMQQTLLGFGTIVIQTFVGDLVLETIHHPQRVQERLIKVIKKYGHQALEEIQE